MVRCLKSNTKDKHEGSKGVCVKLHVYVAIRAWFLASCLFRNPKREEKEQVRSRRGAHFEEGSIQFQESSKTYNTMLV